MTKPRVIYWFRTDLRLHDSPALTAALDLKPECLYPVWCWDPHYVYRARVGPNRFQFLIDCQNDLSESITKLNKKSKLFVLREGGTSVLPKLFKAWKITHLVFEKDTDAYARDRDAQVMELAKKAGVEVIVKSGRTLWDSDEIVKAHNSKPTMSIQQLQAAGAKLGDIAEPLPAPKSLPDPGELNLNFEQKKPDSKPDFNEHFRDAQEQTYDKGLAGPDGDFSVPTLEQLGMPKATTPHKGGETVVLESLGQILADEEYTATFEKPKTSPAAFEPQSTCLTSPHLHFGSLSCRYFYHAVEKIISKRKAAKKPASDPPTSLHGQLLFRDMYFAAQAAVGWSFAQTHNNPYCRFIPWHLPSKLNLTNNLITGDHGTTDATKEAEFQRWRQGRTGFPWIDAIMRQLRSEGWIHHLARHSVACFLTRGGAYISWERGAEVFEELLIDHETACNVGNWQWLSCTAFYAQFYRCYSPVAFGKKWDPEGQFVRRYVPELKGLDKKFIYEPHKAPIQDQRKAGVVVKGDGGEGTEEEGGLAVYPKPMFDFAKQREVCLQGMKKAYHVGLHGDSPEVLDGSWKRLFDDAGEGPTEGEQGGPGGLESFEDAEGDGEIETPKRGGRGAGVGAGAGAGSPGKKSPSKKDGAGVKRERSQSTLDGAFGKKAKK
ncbi:hypothetical protein MBLNU230_g0314t1 [Neophaeotheca triangularis]